MGLNHKDPRGNVGGGSNIGGSRPLTIDECFERYEKALDEVRQQSAEVFRHLKISIDPKLTGEYAERAGDRKILETIFSRLCDGKEGDPPLRVLEVGAGPTLSIKDPDVRWVSDELSPWLSRGLKRAFEDLIDMTVSDRQPERFQHLVVVTHRGKYVQHAAIVPPIDPILFDRTTDVFPQFEKDAFVGPDGTAVALDQIREMVKSPYGDLLPDFEKLIKKHREVLSKEGSGVQVHILPAMAPAHEKIHYDLVSIPCVDYRRLDDGRIAGNFDFVFGRHLLPTLDSMERLGEDVNRALQPILRPGGSAIFAFDGEELTYQNPG
jgi:hypothetical protein